MTPEIFKSLSRELIRQDQQIKVLQVKLKRSTELLRQSRKSRDIWKSKAMKCGANTIRRGSK